MTSGLAVSQTKSGFDPAARMLSTKRDMAGCAETHPLAHAAGTRFDYADANTLIVSGILRDAAGGAPPLSWSCILGLAS
jgi:CubicO group peptidase (beta-lactamase class C family)